LIVGHQPVSRLRPTGSRSLGLTGSIVSSSSTAGCGRVLRVVFEVVATQRSYPRGADSTAPRLSVGCVAKERLKSPRARLFVALDLPQDVRSQLASWQRSFEDPALRPTRPENLHMTLAFLGYRPEKEIDRIAEVVRSVRSPAPELQLRPEPVGVPRGKRPRLFAIDVESPGAVELQAEVERRLIEDRFHEPEKRPFWPHLTVARVRPERKGGRKPAAVETPPGPLPEHTFLRPIPAVRLVLFRSHLKRSGAEYEPVAELELPTAR
jgi:2'-5' RNA ligase